MKRLLTIQDLSAVGRCSLTVALPVLSACGIETAVLPSAVLSTHTGGFGRPAVCDLTDRMDAFFEHWNREGVLFDAVYTGYLENTKQADSILNALPGLLRPEGMLIVDPAMADHGRLYSGLSEEHVSALKRLCRRADWILPNMTELCLLTGNPYSEDEGAESVRGILKNLPLRGGAVVTGVQFNEDEIGALTLCRGTFAEAKGQRLPGQYHGTGDLFASVFCAGLLRGMDGGAAADLAVAFIADCIRNTPDTAEKRFGVCFEPLLCTLEDRIRAYI